MILYVNGDSHSHGMRLQLNEKFSSIVADAIGYDVVNVAQGGASNARIMRTTREYIDSGSVADLMLIGWTTWEREEWQYQGQYYNVNSSGHDPLPKDLQQLYKNWVTEQTPDTLSVKSQYWHNEIFKLHLELVQKISDTYFLIACTIFFKQTINKIGAQTLLDLTTTIPVTTGG